MRRRPHLGVVWYGLTVTVQLVEIDLRLDGARLLEIATSDQEATPGDPYRRDPAQPAVEAQLLAGCPSEARPIEQPAIAAACHHSVRRHHPPAAPGPPLMFDDLLRQLQRIPKFQLLPISLQLDDERHLDRRCPAEECGAAFKVLVEDWREKVPNDQAWCAIAGSLVSSDSGHASDGGRGARIGPARWLSLLVMLGAAMTGCALVGFPMQVPPAVVLPSAPPSPPPSPSPTRTPGARRARPAITRGAVYSVATHEREIAITIDDGGDPAVCAAMAQTLLRLGATATFFPIGHLVARSPAVWARIAQRFPIGNHTADHATLTRLDAAEIEREILQDERLVERAIGHPPIHVLRPPGGAWDRSVRRVAAALGYPVLLLWNVTDADTALHSHAVGMLRDAMRGGPGSVLLMHCNRPISERLLPRIIEGYRARGFRFVTIPQLLGGR